jgi:DedD protein
MAEQQQDVDALKRRGRRRLVGAVALVLLAVIVLPMVFDSEPRTSAPSVSVRIPGEDDAPFTPKLPAKAPEKKEAAKPPEKKEAAKPPEKEIPKIVDKKTAAKAPSLAERARAEAALAGQQFFVPVGAFANPGAVIARLAEAKLPYYTEELAIATGKVTRVRAGPFASRDSAEKAAEKLRGLGLKPGNVAAKS